MSPFLTFPKHSLRSSKAIFWAERQPVHWSPHHGHRSILDYAMEFRTLATDSGLHNAAFNYAYLSGLSPRIKEQLISLELPDELDSIIAVTNRIDCRLHDHNKQ